MRSSSSRRDRLEVHEVEPQPIGRDERAGLLDVRCRAPAAARRGAGASRCGCGASRRAPRRRLRPSRGRGRAACRMSTRTRCARGQSRPDADEPFDGRRRVAGFVVDPAGVRHLAAGLEVERRPARARRTRPGPPRGWRPAGAARRTAPGRARRSRAWSCSPRTGRRHVCSSSADIPRRWRIRRPSCRRRTRSARAPCRAAPSIARS